MYFHNTSLKQFYGIVFSKYFLWGNSVKLYSENIFFRATLRSCIPTLPFEATFLSCIPTLLFEAILQNCILKTFHLRQLSGVVFSQYFFEAILWNCILKIFPWKQFCGIVFSKYFLLGNSAELYSHNTSSLRQFYGIVF